MTVFATPTPITAALTTAGARVRVTAGERADTIVRVEPLDGTNRADVRVAERTEVELTEGRLSVRTTKPGSRNGSVAITIELPAGSRLELDTAWTDLRANGPLGDCDLSVSSGRVELDRVAALRADLAAGDLVIGHVAGAATLDGGAAGVCLAEVDGPIRYRASAGALRIGHARSAVDLTGASGSFDIDHADADVVARAGHCPIRIGRLTRGVADLANAAGGIEVGIDEHTAVTVKANSTKGNVRDTVTGTGPFTRHVELRASTRRGDIVVRGA
ncbi:hypothetical protein BLA60_17085 [Actinophytocola xinjiangensis]|uniref:Adhesin n=1 Tax=Actinophytocola xinjiangensis TaxID=485602 RepID=A0A7Z1AY72_9PSEU|nr:hypothetical protein [Actinophytocola xinjiangensis]OLF10160.1 hypothetical protein BLA60_17085 [Actinophytocola xinjiangensis]